ncbi:MAG: nucleotidyl transferase AbiEii/AbiGii toxin family protein [Candidatus Melainabacteria bacterium]|nr:nucleotidyl transferase AbiEii/AbiGii toxin family protein [Candidatus Melainabacteria bacterium]
MRFKNDRDYYHAITDEIHSQSQDNEARAVELRRDYALERCMSRFDASEVAVKGGFGVRTIVSPSPLTTDIDILLNKPEWRDMPKERAFILAAEYIVDAITDENKDRFKFSPVDHGHITDLRPDQAMGKIWVQVAIGDFTFSTMQIDFGFKPDDTPIEHYCGRDVLAFAGVKNPAITTASREYLAADKISLVLEQGVERPRDLIHAALLLESGKFDPAILEPLVEKLARYRNVHDKLVHGLPDPERDWIIQVDLVSKRYQIGISGQQCFDRVNDVLRKF